MIGFIQVLLPSALLLWLIVKPARHRAVRLFQLAATGAVVLAVHFAGVWIFIPWWTPWIFWITFAGALLRVTSFPSGAVAGRGTYVAAALWSGLTGIGGWAALDALSGRTPPAGAVAMLAMPLPPGDYYVANGGSRAIVNAHRHTLGAQRLANGPIGARALASI